MLEFVRKLGVKPGHRVVALNSSEADLARLQSGLPPGACLDTELGEQPADVIIIWLRQAAELGQLFERIGRALASGGAIWVVIPKKPVARRQGLSIDWRQVVAAALQTGLVDNKVLTFSSEEYGTRFMRRLRDRQPSAP